MTELTLHIPSDKELSYRSYLILDEATMSYNMGYGDNGGCTYHKTAEELYEWYQYWKTPDRFYAYIQRDKDHAFIGEVSLHKNERNDWFEMGIIIEAKYRGMGYSVPALPLAHKSENGSSMLIHLLLRLQTWEIPSNPSYKTHPIFDIFGYSIKEPHYISPPFIKSFFASFSSSLYVF